jgi:hypothetical protein
MPPADGTNGKVEYIAGTGDTLAAIAEAHGQTVADLLLANPGLDPAAPLTPGAVVAILDDTRLANLRAIAGTQDNNRLVERIREEMAYATSHSATPGDMLEAVKQQILATRPGDAGFAAVVEEQAEWMGQLWKAQGRSHEVMDPLFAMARQGNAVGLREAVLSLFGKVAATSPTVEALEEQAALLLRYGPQGAGFEAAVQDALKTFLVDRPADAAAQLAETYDKGGALAASTLLRALTQPGNTDPLSAALILNAARDTIEQIISHLDTAKTCALDVGSSLDTLARMTIFGDLSAAADSAGRSAEAAGTIRLMAERILEHEFLMVGQCAEQGDGITLALEMIRRSEESETQLFLALTLADGIEEFKAQLRESVSSFAQTGLKFSDPALLLGQLLENPETAFKAVLEATDEDGATLRDSLSKDIARISGQGYQLMRVITTLDEYAPYLEDFEDLLQAGALPAKDSDPMIELALGTTPALLEVLRSTNLRSLQDESSYSPYALLDDFPPDANIQLGVGAALSKIEADVLGVENKTVADAAASGNGWGERAPDLLYVAKTTVEATQAISALLAQRMNIDGLTPDEIKDLPLFEAGLGLLHAIFSNHLQTLGLFSIVASSFSAIGGGDSQSSSFERQLPAVLASYRAANPLEWTARALRGIDQSMAVLRDFNFNVATYSSAGGVVIQNHGDSQDRSSRREPYRADHLDPAGLRRYHG